VIRPFIPDKLRKRIFQQFHSPSHPGIRASQRLIGRRVVWPNMKKDVKDWTRTCIPCQQCKVTRHVRSAPGVLPTPTRRFEVIHVDIVGPLTPSRGHRYLLTCIDRFTRWVEAIPMENATAESTFRAFSSGWISRFGAPVTVITDRGVQFESTLMQSALKNWGTDRKRTTAYHPQSNGFVERVHRRLKESIESQPEPHRWMDALPEILLYLHATPATDTNVSPAEYVYGEELRLYGEYVSKERPTEEEALDIVRRHAETLEAPKPRKQSQPTSVHVPKDLLVTPEVLVRVDAVRTGFDRPYEGPYKVIRRHEKFFVLDKGGKYDTVSIDRLKPFHREPEVHPPTQPPEQTEDHNATSDQTAKTTRSGRVSRPPARLVEDSSA